MPAGLKFYTDSGKGTEAQTDLNNATVAVYNDGTSDYTINFYADNASPTRTAATGIADAKVFVYTSGNDEYIVDNSASTLTFKLMDITTPATPAVKYSLSADTAADLGNILKLLGSGTDAEIVGKLLSIVNPSSSKTVLAEKVAETAVVDAILNATKDNGSGTQVKIVETELESTFAKITAITDKADKTALAELVKVDGSNVTSHTDGGKALVAAILDIEGTTPGKTVLQEKVAETAVVDAILNATKDNGSGTQVKIVETELAKVFNSAGTSSAQDLSDYLKTSKLGEELIKQDVVNVLVPALSTVGSDNEKKVYTQKAVDDALALKVDIAGDNATPEGVNIMLAKLNTDVLKKPFAEAILGAKDGQKLVLVTELGKALDLNDPNNTAHKVYGTAGQEKIAKAFLGEKGLQGPVGPTGSATIDCNSGNFASEVRKVMSTPIFDIPQGDDAAPLDWNF